MYRRFGTLCQFHVHKWCELTPPLKIEMTERFETSANKIHTLENQPKESIQHSEHGESLKSRIVCSCICTQKMKFQVH
jgi:hypothetical protein